MVGGSLTKLEGYKWRIGLVTVPVNAWKEDRAAPSSISFNLVLWAL